MNKVELRIRAALESVLWGSRWAVVVAVLMSLVVAAVVLLMACADACHVAAMLVRYEPGSGSERSASIAGAIEVVDGFLLAAVMLMFAIGLYSIFIGTVSPIPKAKVAALVIETLDELKSRLSKTIMLIIFVKLFGVIMMTEVQRPIDAVYLGLGALIAGAAMALLHYAEPARAAPSARPSTVEPTRKRPKAEPSGIRSIPGDSGP